jgi:hypothetical protein
LLIINYVNERSTSMKYPRPAYHEPGVPVERKKSLRPGSNIEFPKFDYPVTPKENYKLAAARKTPYWMPNSMTDDQMLMAQDLVTGDVRGMQSSLDISRLPTENYTFNDWFNTNWTFVVSAGGPMLTPGFVLCDDITKWSRDVIFPDLKEWDFTTVADQFMKTVYDPSKLLHINIGQGLTERLISVLGGYTEGMLALAVEPDAVRDFFNRFADFTIEYVNLIASLYPVDMMTYHDDWGTEKDTFFSEKMMEEIVFEPTKRIIDHIRSKGILFEFHCCGNNTRFIPYMINLHMDFLQLQRRAVDLPSMKRTYGDKIGFNVFIEGALPGVTYTKEETSQKLRDTVDLYGNGGGASVNIFEFDPERAWNTVSELYAYSREFYDKERGE